MRKQHLAIAGATALVLALAACSATPQSPESADPSSGAVTPITVLTAPAIVNVSLYYAIEGAFADHGLKATARFG